MCQPLVRFVRVAAVTSFVALSATPEIWAQCPPTTTTLVATDVADDRSFGCAVAFDSGLATLLVGAETDDASANDRGAAYVFTPSATTWTQVAKLGASDATATARFGHSLKLSTNGGRALIGAPGDDAHAADAGATYVFTKSGASWSQTAKLVASDPDAGDAFGSSVAFAADGTLAWIGSPGDDLGGADAGAAYVCVDPGLGWIEIQKLVPPAGHAGARFGSAVAASANGDLLAVGAPGVPGLPGAGEVFVYRRVGGVWTLDATLQATFPVTSLGTTLDLAASGDVVLAGANSTGAGAGNAAVWRRTSGVWGAAVQLAAPIPTAGEGFGASVALDALGTRAVIGASGATKFVQGAAYVFDYVGSAWTQGTALGGSATASASGAAVACAADGGQFAAGAPQAALLAGLVDVRRFVDPPTVYCTAKPNSLGCAPQLALTGCPSATAGSGFDITATHVLNGKNGLFFYGTSGEQAVAFQGGWLCAKPPHKRIALQNSGGNPPPGDCSGAYTTDFNAWIASGADPALVAGAHFAGQWWSRDPGATFQTGLSAAARGDVAP
ncbi:MAG: FG-GAP repeat protein [Planctomycetes bacterium]|nr:FG-GAP repeat protein [Planctomycetota bacterium]